VGRDFISITSWTFTLPDTTSIVRYLIFFYQESSKNNTITLKFMRCKHALHMHCLVALGSIEIMFPRLRIISEETLIVLLVAFVEEEFNKILTEAGDKLVRSFSCLTIV